MNYEIYPLYSLTHLSLNGENLHPILYDFIQLWKYLQGKAAENLLKLSFIVTLQCLFLLYVISLAREPKKHLDLDRRGKNLQFLDLQCASWRNELVLTWIAEGWLAKATIYHPPCQQIQLKAFKTFDQRKKKFLKKK